jgi:hypothetical protein
MIEYEVFTQFMNQSTSAGFQGSLFSKICNTPNRYIPIFRSSKNLAKLVQSTESFYDFDFKGAYNEIFSSFLVSEGFKELNRNLYSSEGELLKVDQLLQFPDDERRFLLVDIQVRDDQSIRKNQFAEQFYSQIAALRKQYNKKEQIVAIQYFIDPNFRENYKFFVDQQAKISILGVEARVFYGQELFNYLQIPTVFGQIREYFQRWQTEVLDMPSLDFDLLAQNSAIEIEKRMIAEKDALKVETFIALLDTDSAVDEILPVLFPTGETLRILIELPVFRSLKNSDILREKIENFLSSRLSAPTK